MPSHLTKSALDSALGDGSMTTLTVALPTPAGLKGKQFPASSAPAVLDGGCEMSAYLLATDPDMNADSGYPWLGRRTGDMLVRPDPNAIFTAAWLPTTALVLADAFETDGALIPHAPRQILRTQVERLAEHGLTATLGVEAEALVYRTTRGDAHARGYVGLERGFAGDTNGDYSLEHPDPLTRLLRRLVLELAASGLPVHAVKTESVPGQVEITFDPASPVAACDRHAVYKHAARAIADQDGMMVNWMAKPHPGHNGSGCHLHLSLTDADDAQVFTGQGPELGPTASRAVAGCLDLLADAAPLYAPTVNSYRRYLPGVYAPLRVDWGVDDRLAALRLTGRGEHRRIECRLPGADCSPYLAAAALIAGIVHGLDHDLPLSDPAASGPSGKRKSIRELPADLSEAARRFQASPVLREAFGDPVIEHYAHASQAEVESLREDVGPAELRRGLACA